MKIILLSFLLSINCLATVKIAILDTGYDSRTTNPEYLPKFCKNVKYVDNHGHGTHVTGIIAKKLNNKKIDYCVDIFYKTDYHKSLFSILKGKYDYVNISLVGDEFDLLECITLKNIIDTGTTVVTAAGNDARDISKLKTYPAMCDDRIYKVMNLDKNKNLNPSSNYLNHERAVKYLGTKVLSTVTNNQLDYYTGTSQASPGFLSELVIKNAK